jgi:hypothetical protein
MVLGPWSVVDIDVDVVVVVGTPLTVCVSIIPGHSTSPFPRTTTSTPPSRITPLHAPLEPLDDTIRIRHAEERVRQHLELGEGERVDERAVIECGHRVRRYSAAVRRCSSAVLLLV